MSPPTLPVRTREQLCALVFDFEPIGESNIAIGQRSAMLLARHQLAGKK